MALREGELQAIAESSLAAGANPRLARFGGDALALQGALGQLLDEQPDLLLRVQHPLALATLHRLGIIDATGHPRMGGVRVPALATVKEQFSRDQLQAATSEPLRHPQLLLVPDWDIETCRSMINAHRVSGQNPTEIDAALQKGKRRECISSWQPMIVDASKGPTGGTRTCPTQGEDLRKFIARICAQHPETSGPIDVRTYTMLLLTALSVAKRINDLIDVKSTTILLGALDETCPNHVPVAKFLRKDNVLGEEVNHVRMSMYDVLGIGEDFDAGGHWIRPTIVGNRIRSR